jgi:hypothetical protein
MMLMGVKAGGEPRFQVRGGGALKKIASDIFLNGHGISNTVGKRHRVEE